MGVSFINRKSKIVATMGPAIKSYEMLRELLEKGVDVMRLNFSHGDHKAHKQNIEWIRKASAELQREIAILADLQGPKIRTGIIPEMIILKKGQDIYFTGSNDRQIEGDGTKEKPVSISYPRLAHELRVGDALLIEDGLTRMEIEAIYPAKNLVHAKVIFGETLSSRKGVNIPSAKLTASAITEKDWEDILFCIGEKVDFFALSFVRSAQEVKNLKSLLASKSAEIQVIAKIEKPEALENLEEIVAASDALMIARGDLGVEIGNEKVPFVQKKLIKMARTMGKPVITATQMLMSMVTQPTPSRAEASDVANAVFDGSDALMLSNETASGSFPLKAVETMDTIIRASESSEFEMNYNLDPTVEAKAPLEAAAVLLSKKIQAKALGCLTRSGHTARNLSRLNPQAPIFAFVENPVVRRQLALSRGVFVIPWKEVQSQDYTIFDSLANELGRLGVLKKNDVAVFTAGIPTSRESGTSNTVALRKFGASE
ncbi:MAG: pyruvate kinase [bacterium]